MDNNKLGNKIRDWILSLGFRFPDGSTPPADFFAFLIVTPHRHQLWETLVETIQPRQKIEIMRKQIFVAKLQERKKTLKKCDSKQKMDRIEWWCNKQALESEFKEKRKAITKIERTIMDKASGLLFEIYKHAILENQNKELGEKGMILKLLSKRQKNLMKDLNKGMSKIKPSFCGELKGNSVTVKNELINIEDCKCLQDDTQECKLLNEIKNVCESGISEQQFWEDFIRLKRMWISDFSLVLQEFSSFGKNVLREKIERIQEALGQSVVQLKQKVTEKAMLAIINSVEGKQLSLEAEKFEEEINCDELSSGTVESISDKMNVCSDESEISLTNVKNYLYILGLQSYLGFLKEKVKNLNVKTKEEKSRDELNITLDGEGRLQMSFKEFEHIVDEIKSLKAEGQKVEAAIISNHEKLEAAILSQREKTEAKNRARALEDVVDKLKVAAEKQVDLLEIPLNVFRTVKSSLGRTLFECESASRCLNNYAGELNHFFSAMLILPSNDLERILSEIRRRKKSLNDIKTFITERDKLAALQRKIRDQISVASVKYDSHMCKRNFKESGRILGSVSYKAEELLHDMDFVKKIFKNWVEQPYRFTVTGTLEGKSLKEYEEKHLVDYFVQRKSNPGHFC